MVTLPSYPIPPDEAERLAALDRLQILDTDSDERFDRIARIAAAKFNVPVARISFVDGERVWSKSSVGTAIRQAPRRIAICAHTIMGTTPLVIPDLAADPRFAASPQVAGKPHFRFYAGAPIMVEDGLRVGAICLMDYVPRPDLSTQDRAILCDLAEIVVDELRLTRAILDRDSVIDAQTRDLKESEERFALAMQGANDGLWDWNFKTGEVYYSPRWTGMLGYTPDEVEPTLDGGWERFVDPADRDRVLIEVQNYLAGTADNYETEFRMRHKRGSWVTVLSRAHLVREDGAPVRLVGTHVDITQHKQLEEQVRQAQKMEAVGQLTGGIAHDFNNMLGVIQGNAEMLQEDFPEGAVFAGPILRAARRGAELTQRLLAFSRRQPLRPQTMHLGELISGISDMLVRSLGETITIETRAPAGLWAALADPGQVENALLNLAINARDAMPGGGRLTISCANAPISEGELTREAGIAPGDFVALSVSDTGTGMPPDVRARVFEPFFTTKQSGQGTGLGLSMVYGFAKQSGGHVTIDSEEGKGTTVRLYLPRSAAALRPDPEAGETRPAGRGERILVVEDDPDVRAMVVKMLENLRYTTVDVPDAASAHAVLARGTPIDLVLSDVVLPGGVSGPGFAKAARATHPDLKVIFMSGYPATATRQEGFPSGDAVLLNKPFRRHQVAEALRQSLDRR